MTTLASPVIEAISVSKSFGATRALDEVSFTVEPGQVHALIGLNGSGKSTIVKALAGVHEPDSGTLRHGKLAVVHQDLGLVPALSIVENFVVGRRGAMRWGMIDWKVERERARSALAAFEMTRDLGTRIDQLSAAERVTVAVARAMDRAGDEVVSGIVLDEPTSALPAHETSLLADAIRRFAAAGLGVVLITHRLQEVIDLAERVTVLRDGRVVFAGALAGRTPTDLANLMVGTVPPGGAVADLEEPPDGTVASGELRARDVTHGPLEALDLSLPTGQIVGVFGVHGSGAEELALLLSGRSRPERGTVELDGIPVSRLFGSTTDIAFIPSDRPQRGILPTLSVAENIAVVGLKAMVARGRIPGATVRSVAERWIEDLHIKAASEKVAISSLSGGNQQKAILARWLQVAPRVIVAEEPTQGIDVWAKQDILRNLRAAARAHAVVALCAGEPEEIIDFCDRVVVLNRGRIVLDRPRSATTTAELLGAMH